MDNTIETLIKLMTVIGNHKNMSGEEKKSWVLLRLKEEMKLDKNIENIIIEIIDYIVLVEKGNIIINPKIKKGFFGCCKKK